MSNNRVYPSELFDREMRRFEMRMKYCPKCFSNNLSFVDKKEIILFDQFICLDCDQVFLKTESIDRDDIRSKKIDKILK
jgi:transposase-like protein